MHKFLPAAFAGAVVLSHTLAFAENAEAQPLEAEPSVKLPSVEAAAFYNSMKIERGMVENDESVFGYEVAIEWYGLFGGVEACYDMTKVNERQGRYNEIASFLGYGYKFGDLTAKAAYVYKAIGGDEPDTQEVEMEFEYETPWVNPFVELLCDTYEKPGALYGFAGLSREWECLEWLTLQTFGGIGFGNGYRNDADFEYGRWAARDIHLGCTLEIEVCPHVKIVPNLDFYDYFTESQRKSYDKFNGFVCAAGCKLALDF